MGDAADDAYDAADREQALFDILSTGCPEKRKACDWYINEDGLYECDTCGKVTDA